LSFALKRIGPLAAIIIIVFYLLILYLFTLPNTPKNPFASIYSESLIKNICQLLLLLVGFDTLIYRKYYDTPPILVGHQTVSELMKVANRFVDREDAYHNKRARSPEYYRSGRHNNQRHRPLNDDRRNTRIQVAAGHKTSSEEVGERRNNRYHKKDDSGGDRSRNFDPSPEDILNGPCHIHYTDLDGKRISNHLMRDCRTFVKLQEAMELSQAAKLGYTAYGAQPPSYNKGAINQGYQYRVVRVIPNQRYTSPQ
jgi:hypothetical protein